MSSIEDRYERQADIVLREKIDGACTVIGVGAIGRQVALQLASIGVPELQLIDFDDVEATNCVTQGYCTGHIGLPKVLCTTEDCYQINKDVSITQELSRYKSSIDIGKYIFICVDSIDSRRFITQHIREFDFLVDGRMTAEVMRVLCRVDSDYGNYTDTLYSDDEIFRGTCTAKSTIYCANVVAGIMVSQFTKFLRFNMVNNDVMFNLLAMDLMTDVNV